MIGWEKANTNSLVRIRKKYKEITEKETLRVMHKCLHEVDVYIANYFKKNLKVPHIWSNRERAARMLLRIKHKEVEQSAKAVMVAMIRESNKTN
jgi:hypothetical protein